MPCAPLALDGALLPRQLSDPTVLRRAHPHTPAYVPPPTPPPGNPLNSMPRSCTPRTAEAGGDGATRASLATWPCSPTSRTRVTKQRGAGWCRVRTSSCQGAWALRGGVPVAGRASACLSRARQTQLEHGQTSARFSPCCSPHLHQRPAQDAPPTRGVEPPSGAQVRRGLCRRARVPSPTSPLAGSICGKRAGKPSSPLKTVEETLCGLQAFPGPAAPGL